jgi:outer membrane protein assembly factor BamB
MKSHYVYLRCVLLACAVFLTAACPPDQHFPPWNQFHGDAANSGQTLMATVPAQYNTFYSADIGHNLEFTSPVFAPDGTVFFSVSGKGGGSNDGVFKMNTSGGAIVVGRNAADDSEQLSTPAVDATGWIYAALLIEKHKSSELLMIPPGIDGGFILHINGTALAPPKIMQVNGGRLIFVSYYTTGQHLQIWNNLNPADSENIQPKLLVDREACERIEGGGGGGIGFHIPGIELPAPFPEDPAPAIAAVGNERGDQLYVVVPSSRCGITFFRMDLAATQTDAPALTTIKVVDTDAFLNTPVISPDGTVVISDSDKRTTAYDVTTGNEKWHFDSDTFVASTPTLPPLGITSVYVTSYSQITKLDLATGQVQAQAPVSGLTDASPAIGGQYIFVSTVAGLSTYDLDLKLLAFAPLAGGRSSPIINTDTGQVNVAATDGKFYVFNGP